MQSLTVCLTTLLMAEPKPDSIIIKDVAKVAVAGKDFKLPKTLSRFSDLVGSGRVTVEKCIALNWI